MGGNLLFVTELRVFTRLNRSLGWRFTIWSFVIPFGSMSAAMAAYSLIDVLFIGDRRGLHFKERLF